ncbi:hypothetical protein FIBSPDRAFT_963586 [Athelia psychrophila]|uniref:G domain-containing protein n=1 Tax=Athelia psychrophila TaxID=1759441 RepID=A0A165YU83_9AGAM|nr:hypothetical protein FIBSPDRAFT_963586 [Fibularhizoctonia sp. CBS 109695]
MPLFQSLRRRVTPPGFRPSTPPGPFTQLGSPLQPAPVLDTHGQNIRGRFDRIRILVIGRANSGKTTVLQKVCGTTDQPEVFDASGNKIKKPNFLEPSRDRGLHDINNAAVFKTNPGFIFHDSRGFESGGAQELEDVKAFISARSDSIELEDQIHAIWYCIPVDDDRPFIKAEIDFFSECGTGNVPVIVLFTKFDAMDDKAFAELKRSVLIITLDLSFFIWDKSSSTECLSQALSIYKEAATNHEAVMKAVTDACRMEQGDSDEEKMAFRGQMKEIVLAHRLSESYRAEMGRG